MRKLILLLGLGLLLTTPVQARVECGISEQVILENTTDASVTHTFTRGSHEGFVVLSPGQSVTVDVVWCE